MKPHLNGKKWNIIFLIYAELADAASMTLMPGVYDIDIKAALADLESTILHMELTDAFNVFMIENVIEIASGAITSDYTYIRRLSFDSNKKKNKLEQLIKLRTENFDQESDHIERVFREIDQNYPAEKNILVTWDHGSAFGIFKKTLSDPPVSSSKTSSPETPKPASEVSPIPVADQSTLITQSSRSKSNGAKQLLQNVTAPSENSNFQILSQQSIKNSGVITIVQNKPFGIPDTFFEEFISTEKKQRQSTDFALLSNDRLAEAIVKGFKNKYVDVLLMFNCFMHNMHTCYSLKNAVHYLVAPESNISTPGYDYLAIVNLIKSNDGTDISGDKVAAVAVNTFKQYYKRRNEGAAFELIALFAVCLKDYSDNVIKPLKNLVTNFESKMQDPSFARKLAGVRKYTYAFGLVTGMDYFLVDLINYMQDLNKATHSEFSDLEKSLKAAYDSITIGNSIGRKVYSDGIDTFEYKKRKPTGLSIYFPPAWQPASNPVMKNFMIPNAPFSTSLIKAIKWIGFLSKLYKTPI